jgi:hypothetical protein
MHRLILTMATAAAIAVATDGHAASPSVSEFPEFTACAQAKGTWYKSNMDQNILGHRINWQVQNGVLYTQDDHVQGTYMLPLAPVRSIERNGKSFDIVVDKGSKWTITPGAGTFTGDVTAAAENGTRSTLNFTCGAQWPLKPA